MALIDKSDAIPKEIEPLCARKVRIPEKAGTVTPSDTVAYS